MSRRKMELIAPSTNVQFNRAVSAIADSVAAKLQPQQVAVVERITVKDIWVDYRKTRRLAPRSIETYERLLANCINDWMSRDIRTIDKSQIEERHRSMTEKRGKTQANGAFHLLRSLINFADIKYDLGIGINPVKILGALKQWNKSQPRTSIVRAHELGAFLRACRTTQNRLRGDLSELILFTGLRKSEALGVLWANVDFEARTLTVERTKNTTDHTLPLTDHVMELLSRRAAECQGSRYVFPGRWGTQINVHSYLTGDIGELFGRSYALHELRRSFASIARRIGIDTLTISRLLNQLSASARGTGVTPLYLIEDVECLREPMQRITNYILEKAALTAPTEPKPFEPVKVPKIISTQAVLHEEDLKLLACLAAGMSYPKIQELLVFQDKRFKNKQKTATCPNTLAKRIRQLSKKLLGKYNRQHVDIRTLLVVESIRLKLIDLNEVHELIVGGAKSRSEVQKGVEF